jgi:hypothetical protein
MHDAPSVCGLREQYTLAWAVLVALAVFPAQKEATHKIVV